MKKTVFSAFMAILAGAAFAAANDKLVMFSTKGPDTYADGTQVLDKECYALVWDRDSEPFSIAADGSTTGGDIVLYAPFAEKGRCPKVLFEVDAELVASKYTTGGSWKVYLLDTRRFGDTVTLAPFVDGKPSLVNAAGLVGNAAISLSSGTPNAISAATGTSTATATALPAGDGNVTPKISDINVSGDFVYVTVENTRPYLAYDLTEGAKPGEVTERVNNPRTGGDDGKVVLVAPKKDGGAFFRVNRK